MQHFCYRATARITPSFRQPASRVGAIWRGIVRARGRRGPIQPSGVPARDTAEAGPTPRTSARSHRVPGYAQARIRGCLLVTIRLSEPGRVRASRPALMQSVLRGADAPTVAERTPAHRAPAGPRRASDAGCRCAYEPLASRTRRHSCGRSHRQDPATRCVFRSNSSRDDFSEDGTFSANASVRA